MRVGAQTVLLDNKSINDSHGRVHRLEDLFVEVKFMYTAFFGLSSGNYCVWVNPVAKNGEGNKHVNEKNVDTSLGKLQSVTISLVASDRSPHARSLVASETYNMRGVSITEASREVYVTKAGHIHAERSSGEYVVSVRILTV